MEFDNIRSRKVAMLSRLSFSLGLLSYLWAQAAIPQNADGAFEIALNAVIATENEVLEEIIANRPELLLEVDARGRTLVENAFLYLNDDHAPQTNFGFLEFLIENDFFDQPIDRTEHFSMAAASLRMVDRHLRRGELTEDMIFHKSRLPLVGLLTSVVEDRIKVRLLESEEAMELMLAVCSPDALEGGEGDYFSRPVSTALKSALTRTNAQYLAVFLSVGTLDKKCVEALLG